MAKKIIKNEGMFVGYTSGAAMQAVYQLNKEGVFKDNSNVVITSEYLSPKNLKL